MAPPPRVGACRVLTPADVHKPSNSTPTVPCTKDHTAETYAVGSFPHRLTTRRVPDDNALGAWIYHRCQQKFISFLGGDQSLVMRATVTWAWFRAPAEAWRNGAHWWRCDVVGGGDQSKQYVALPTTAKGILLGKPDDRWMVCVDGPNVKGSVKIPCSKPHTWRAVTTIVLGKAADPYPGDRVVETRTRDYCSNSVGAWLNYPVDYNYGYTWFHEAEWKAGNRRSICWAQTTK
ncbi:MAG TPA: septum formation family protein [Nocardioidaceae bacterium]|nr:septum formation family protein [Nocardioidaceae bacterium]